MVNDPDAVSARITDIGALVLIFSKRHTSAFYAANTLLAIASIVSLRTIIAGLYDEAKLAALFAVLTGFLISMDSAWAPAEKAQFWREMKGMAENVKLDFQAVGDDDEKFANAIRSFQVLNSRAASYPARGTGMSEVRKTVTALQANASKSDVLDPKIPARSATENL